METYETIRRRVNLITKELWYYLQNMLQSAAYQKFVPDVKRVILDEMAERKRWLLWWQQRLESSDGYEEWRRKEAASVSDLVQRRLSYLQNPPDCRTAKKLICNMEVHGFGCQLHHIAFCLINAYATKRTLLLHISGWRYNYQGWESVFYPLSNTCNDNNLQEIKEKYLLGKKDPSVVLLGTLRECESYKGLKYFLPYHYPKDIMKRVARFNGDPASWWIGQMIKYILRPRNHILKVINETINKLRFSSPVVGVQVRGTDKINTEAEFHDIDEYMSHVADYYAQLQLTRDVHERRVYLATDEPRVFENASLKYKQYIFYSNDSIIQLASDYQIRYSPESLTGLLVDLHALSLCDYVVCTFSSNLCRLVYEMKQANLVDASNSVYSLDYVYFFAAEEPYYRTAVKRNKGRINSIDLKIGDRIKMKYWNSTSNKGNVTGANNVFGSVPLYKTARYIPVRPLPEYRQVPIHPTKAEATK